MALAQAASGSQTATIGTTHTLGTITTGKTCVLVVDRSNMVDGETLELSAELKTLAGSTARVVYRAVFRHAGNEVVQSPPIPAVHSVAFKLRQTVGTGRVFDWSIVTLD